MSKAFVAYSSKDQNLANLILEAVQKANAVHAIPTKYTPWEFNEITGVSLTSPIVRNIQSSPFIVADITYLNENVLYEIGLAIGLSKRVWLVRCAEIEGDKPLAQKVGIFDTIGYSEYTTVDDLTDILTAHIDTASLPFEVSINRTAPLYIVEPPTREESDTFLTHRIQKTGYKYRSFNPSEDVRLSVNDAIRQVASSAGIVTSLQTSKTKDFKMHNLRVLFVLGLAHGMDKPTLALCPADDFLPPLDIRDKVKYYPTTDVMQQHIADFCPKVVDRLQQYEPKKAKPSNDLCKLSIGEPTAENEMANLSQYYLQLQEYNNVLNGRINIVVGRKGSGKTALFIQVTDKLKPYKKNIIVDLKPEGYQLHKLKEEIFNYLSEGSQAHLITAFWEYLILLEVAYKLLEKDQNFYLTNPEITELYQELEKTYHQEELSTVGDFSERLWQLSEKLILRYKKNHESNIEKRLTTADITELLYTNDIKNLRVQISKYLNRKESVWVLFDNLDKGWSTKGVDETDAIVLRCLIEAGKKITKEMQREGHTFYSVVFIRNDVYEYLIKNSADHGKEKRATLDWKHPELLKEMLKLRLVDSLGKSFSGQNFDQIWSKLCVTHYKGEDTANYIIERSLMRPRNLLNLFNHILGFANNFNHNLIQETDIEKGVNAYSQDLLTDLGREITDVFPNIEDLLYHFIDCNALLSSKDLSTILTPINLNDNEEEIIDFLLYYGVLGIYLDSTNYFIYNCNYDLKLLKMKFKRYEGQKSYIINPAFYSALDIKNHS